MGSGGAKQTNQQLNEQRGMANQFANTMAGRGAESYGTSNDIRDYLLNTYKGLYSGLGDESNNGGGGGGGVGYTPANFESEALPFYLNMMKSGGGLGKAAGFYEDLMNNGGGLGESAGFYRDLMNKGGYSDADKSNILSYATGPISGLFEGLSRQISSAQAGRGLPSYSGGISRLARDQAYQTGEMSKGVAADLAEKVLASKMAGAQGMTGLEESMFGRKLSGAEGLTGLEESMYGRQFGGAEGTRGIESEKRAFESQERARQLAAARARASRGDYNDRLGLEYLSRIQGLMPNDLPYADRELAGIGTGLQAAGSRVNETPFWQKALANMIPTAAGAGIGAFSGGGIKKPADDEDYTWA